MEEKVCAYAIIRGKVQGVCYRMETKRTADSYGVYGWVKNKKNGSVEAMFEGEKEAVDAMLEWCKEGPSHAKVCAVDIDWKKYTNKFENFNIL